LVELASANDYVLVETTLYNAFFVRKLEYETFLVNEIPDTSIEALHENTMGTSLYQLYDGTLKLWGCKRMLWHRIPIDEEKLQMIPSENRTFPYAPPIVANNIEPFNMSEVVDMSSYCKLTKSDTNRNDCASRLYSQLQNDGFALIRGTGIEQIVCQKVLDACHNFLQVADEDVRRSCLAVDRARRGYSPMNCENFGSLLGEKVPNDLVRKFRIGPPNVTSERDSDNDGVLLQPNIWPSREIWDLAISFQSAVEEYYEAACSSVKGVVEAICDGLLCNHPDLLDSLRPLMMLPSKGDLVSDQTTTILTLLGYRVGTRHKGKNRGPLVAAHTDVGVITMLLFDGADTCASLQRGDGHGGWIDISLPPKVLSDPVFVVNVADLLSDLSQNVLPSTIHRVIAQPQSTIPRNCCALFVGLDANTQLTIGKHNISYQEWRKQRIARAQKILIS
jgi:isopenicillin N synthase-like dioxygenase